MNVLTVAIAGFGNVGRAAAHLLLLRRDRYRHRYGVDVRLVAVCGSKSGLFDDAGLEEIRFQNLEIGKTGPDFVVQSGADVLIEAGPSDYRSGSPGLDYMHAMLSVGRDVIVISKGALLREGLDLRELARRSGAMLKISGATAAALPTIDLFDYNLLGCSVLHVDGILNATSNFLLDAMTSRDLEFEEALHEAQAAGFAERDPRNDTEGWDTASKLVILANFSLGAKLSLDNLPVQGIQSITKKQIDKWREERLVPKLVGSVSLKANKFHARVEVRTFPLSDPFAHVSGNNKAIRISTDDMGEVLAIGSGSEPTATAAAALKDLEHILAVRAGKNLEFES